MPPTDFTPKDGQYRRYNAERGEWDWIDPPHQSSWVANLFPFFLVACMAAVVIFGIQAASC